MLRECWLVNDVLFKLAFPLRLSGCLRQCFKTKHNGDDWLEALIPRTVSTNQSTNIRLFAECVGGGNNKRQGRNLIIHKTVTVSWLLEHFKTDAGYWVRRTLGKWSKRLQDTEWEEKVFREWKGLSESVVGKERFFENEKDFRKVLLEGEVFREWERLSESVVVGKEWNGRTRHTDEFFEAHPLVERERERSGLSIRVIWPKSCVY